MSQTTVLWRSGFRSVLVAFVAVALFATGCGGDDEAEITALSVTVGASGIDGVPAELSAGLYDVTVAGAPEIDFSRVSGTTDAASFPSGVLAVLEGGPFPDFLLDSSGVAGQSLISLEEGKYIVWVDTSGDEESSTPEDIIAQGLTVKGGDAPDLPEADGSIVIRDYEFDIDVPTGPATINIVNDSDEQFHHVIIIDAGSNDPQVLEEKFGALLQSEDPEFVPEGIDPSQLNFGFASSGVFGPGSAGTLDVNLVEGGTYVVVCFIQDRTGGAPHAIGHDMFQVFQA